MKGRRKEGRNEGQREGVSNVANVGYNYVVLCPRISSEHF